MLRHFGEGLAALNDLPASAQARTAPPRTGGSGAFALGEAIWRRRFLRFLVVGAINTAFGYGAFAVCVLVGMHYAVAALVSNVLGILFNFKTTGVIVFSSRDNSLLLRFFGVYLVNYAVSVGLMKLFKALGVPVLVTAAVLMLPLAALSYVLNRAWVFEAGAGRR